MSLRQVVIIGFTLPALLALPIQFWIYREVYLDELARRAQRTNGIMQLLSEIAVRSALFRVLLLLLLSTTGIAAWLMTAYGGWFLVPLPFLTLWASWADWRARIGLRR